MQDVHGKLNKANAEQKKTLHQQTGFKIKDETSEMLHLERR